MRRMFYLIPSLLFLLSHVAMDGQRDLPLARMQSEANAVSSEMNRLSTETSSMIQAATLGQVEQEEIQDEIDSTNHRMEEMRLDLEDIWHRMDLLKIAAAEDAAGGRVLLILGMISAVAGFGLIAARERDLAPYCLIAIGLVIGLAGV